MVSNQDNQNSEEHQVRQALNSLNYFDTRPSPFFRTRVLARLKPKDQHSDRNWMYPLILGFALSSLVLFLFQRMETALPQLVVDSPYVIHIDVSSEEARMASSVEMVLPEAIHFVSVTHPELQNKSQLRMPLSVPGPGRHSLPFVIAGHQTGVQRVTVRLRNQQDQMVREKVLNVRFSQNSGSITF